MEKELSRQLDNLYAQAKILRERRDYERVELLLKEIFYLNAKVGKLKRRVKIVKTWELIKICGDGGYIEGDRFQNEAGEQVVFDGHTLKGIDDINPNDKWQCVQ